MARFSYRIAGMAVLAEMELPGAIPAPPEAPDVRIVLQTVPAHLERAKLTRAVWELDDCQFLLSLPGIGRFLAVDGRTLQVDPAPGSELSDVLVFALGTCLGALLYQRGTMVLHASAVALDGKAYAFCGRSGIGKSTLAAALCKAGCSFVSDDVTAVGLDNKGEVHIWPDGRQLKLFGQSIETLGLDSNVQIPVRSMIEKFYVDPPRPSISHSLPLDGVYLLSEDRLGGSIRIEGLGRLDAAQALFNESYRPRLALALGQSGRQMALMAALVRNTPVFKVARPNGLAHLGALVDTLQENWRLAPGNRHVVVSA